ncbi:hypothetical protein GCM10009839_63360 [Catenulispora yoronensis]|uniref:Uncharacterized protein n=1 Tax=Catenulispora yoronensis TaxID=450799 RepID=A0ABP5GS82_9ACTN
MWIYPYCTILGIVLKALRGLNAHYSLDTLAEAYAELREAAGIDVRGTT